MKKLFNFRLLVLIGVLIMSINQVWATDLYLRGVYGHDDTGAWDVVDASNKMSESSGTYTIVVYLSATTYSFKISDSGWTYSNNRGANETSSTVTLGTAYQTWDNGGKGNMSFTPSTSGFYKFSFKTSDNKLTITKYNPSPSAAAPSAVVSGTNAMFYIKGYSGTGYNVIRASSTHSIDSHSTGICKGVDGYSYVNTAKTNLTTNDYISNNPSDWKGEENTNIKTATGGELFNRDGTKTAAKTASTTASVSSETLSISTTTSATTGVLNGSLYIQYYIDGTFTGVTYSASTASYASIPAGGATARASTYNVSSLSNGSHTLKTVLTDGIIYWVADEDNFNVAHTYTITYKDKGNTDYSGSNGASLPGSYTYGVGVSLVPGEKAGYSFGGWYTVSDCSSGLTTSISTSATGDKTFYAKWTLEPGVTLSAASATLNIGQTVRLTATGSNASNITKYDFYEGESKIGSVSTSATSATYDYTPTTTGSKTMKVIMTYNSGSSTVTSSNVGLSINTPSVATLTEASSTTEMWIGIDASDALTFTATSNNVGSGASVTWTISDATGGTFTQTGAGSYSGKSWTYTPATAGSKTITVTMTVGGNNYTKTYSLKVYERWNIYVQNNCGWAGGIALYFYGNETPASWPGVQGTGTGCEQYSAKWWKVTLDSKYTKFILDNNVNGGSGEEKLIDNVAVDKVAYSANSYWDFLYSSGSGPKYYTLHSVSPSVPTVSITSTEVISSTQIKLTGTISNYGSDGSSAASHLKEVGFYCGETKHSTTHTSGSTFTKVITGLTAGTEYTFKAYAVNVKGEGKQASGTNVTTRAGGTYTIKVRTAVGASTPKIYAWTDADANDGVKEENATYGSGATMSVAITGTVYKWWSYNLNKTYNNFLIYETGDGNKTNNITAPQAATCYWYNSSNAIASRYGTMDCPHATPQLYIETTAGGGSYDYYEMTNTSGTLSKSLTLAAKSTYKFKIFYNGEYFGKSATATRGSNTVDDLSAAVETYVQVTTDAAGSYTFEFTTSGKDLTVTYPAAHKITYGIGAINGSSTAIGATSSPSFTSGDYVLDVTAVTFTKGTTKNGYHWEGWYPKTDGTGDAWSTTDANWTSAASTRSADIKVYACYSYNNYTITYHLDGGTNDGDNPSGFTVVTPTITLKDPTKTGYSFDGWYTDEDLTISGNTVPVGTYSNKEFWAKWTAKTYDVILDVNGGSGDNQTVVATYDAAMPTKLKGSEDAIEARTKTGYNFGGYSANNDKSGTQYYTSALASNHIWDVDANNTHIYAMWTAKSCTVNFDFDSSDPGHGDHTSATTSTSATYDAAMTSVTPPTAANGYAFMGYYTGADGAGTQYYDGSGNSATTWAEDTEATTTLYAYYKKAEITALTPDAAVVEPRQTIGITPTVSPTPVGTTIICWEVRYNDSDNPLDPQPETTWSDGKLTFEAPSVSAMYKIVATLKTGNSCAGGTTLHSTSVNVQVAGSHNVTVAYKQGSTTIKASTIVTGRPLNWSDPITAPDIFGYTFDHWTAGDGITLSADGSTPVGSDESSANPIYIKATYNGTLTANYTQKSMIFFKNTLGWSDVYVNFYTGRHWNNPKGSGNQGVTNSNKRMTRLGETDIWYYDYGAASITPSLYVSFTSESQDNTEFFWKAGGVNVVYPANYPDAINTDKASENGFKAATPMFVPLATQAKITLNESSGGKADYYNAGYWTMYTPGTGYRLEIYSNSTGDFIKGQDFSSADELMPMKATVDLEGGQTYKFQLRRGGESSAGVYYGNTGTMTYTNHGQDTPWEMINNPSFSMAGITTNAAGDYTFNLSYSPNASDQYRLRMAVDYPVASGDYRLVYTDDTRSGRIKPSAIVQKENDGSAIVSFFVRKDETPVLRIQQATVALDGTITWKEYPTDGTPTNQITGTIASAITTDTVYNFNLSMNGSGALSVASAEFYSGNYYIRTDAANSKWDNYKTDPDHLLTSSEYLKSDVGYTHYYTHWVNKDDVGRKNVKFVIANDYSPCISDTLARETASDTWANIGTWMEEGGDLKRSANVRFMWDAETNNIARAYIDGAQGDYSTNFLYMLNVEDGDDKIRESDESALTDHKVTFRDNQNWIYEANIQAQPNAQIRLISNWGDNEYKITQYFKGTSEETETLIGGSEGDWYDIRLLYDFKTNRLVAAYVPADGTYNTETAINADVMFIREHQGDIAQVTFGENGKISKINTAYGVLRLNKWTLNNKNSAGGHAPLDPELSVYERSLYWISFPFRVKLSEVFGFGTYGTHWAIQRYDGAARATQGHFLENGSFWRWMDRETDYLEPNQGYLLSIDVDLLGESSDVWGPNSLSERIELYFPSYGKMPDLTSADVEQTIPSYECTINRAATEGLPDTGDPRTSYNRTIFDSHWNVLSVPTYVNTDDVKFANADWITAFGGPNFLYTWNPANNTIHAAASDKQTYKAMHSYMVQYCGDITWAAKSGSAPSSIVARKTYEEAPSKITFRLELQQNEQMLDRTYIVLSNDEEVSANFAFGEDMAKEFNKNKAAIFNYTADHVGVAGNTMPMSDQTTVIPLGLDIPTAGEYTFAIPDGTEGVGVTLIDNETGTRTSLSALDYTVNLTTGTHDGRFVLEISPVHGSTTGVEAVMDDGLQVTGARKVIIDQKLFIIKGDKMYDARGAMVK